MCPASIIALPVRTAVIRRIKHVINKTYSAICFMSVPLFQNIIQTYHFFRECVKDNLIQTVLLNNVLSKTGDLMRKLQDSN